MRALIVGLAGLGLVSCTAVAQPGREQEVRERMGGMQEMLRAMRDQCRQRHAADPAVDCSEYEGTAVDVRPESLGTH